MQNPKTKTTKKTKHVFLTCFLSVQHLIYNFFDVHVFFLFLLNKKAQYSMYSKYWGSLTSGMP